MQSGLPPSIQHKGGSQGLEPTYTIEKTYQDSFNDMLVAAPTGLSYPGNQVGSLLVSQKQTISQNSLSEIALFQLSIRSP
jgi:hypothetical protein